MSPKPIVPNCENCESRDNSVFFGPTFKTHWPLYYKELAEFASVTPGTMENILLELIREDVITVEGSRITRYDDKKLRELAQL